MSNTFKPTTISGHDLGEVTSALQKCIRRGLERPAIHWMFELYNSGFSKHLWKRLIYIASEDIGLADPTAHVQVKSLHSTWEWHKREYKHEDGADKLVTLHALLILVRANKSRVLDDLYWVCEEDWKMHREDVPIPSFALDMFTVEGKKKGRGLRWFFEKSAKLHPHDTTIEGTDELRDETEQLVLFTEANKGKMPSAVAGKSIVKKPAKTAPKPASLKSAGQQDLDLAE